MTQTKRKRAAGRLAKRCLAAVLMLLTLAGLAAGGLFAAAVLRGEWPAAKGAPDVERPRVTVLDTEWCTALARLETQQQIKDAIDGALDRAAALAGDGHAAVALAGRTARGDALFRDGTGTLTTAAALTAGDRYFSRFDAVQYLVARAAARDIPVYWLQADAAAPAPWETAVAQKHGLKLLVPGAGAANGLSTLAAADGSLTLLRADGAPDVLAAAVQLAGPEGTGLVLGSLTALSADGGTAALLNTYLAGGTLPDLALCWAGKTIPQTLTVGYPTADGATVYAASLFLMGTSDPAAPLTLNGAPVARYGTGGVWGVLVTLESGANTFALENGAAALTYTVHLADAGGGTAAKPRPDGTPGAGAVGKKLRVTDAIASALQNCGNSASISDTLFRGATAEIVGVTEYTSGSTVSHGYRLATGDYVRASACQVIDAPDAAFTGCAVAEDSLSRCTVLTFAGSGTPAVYHSRAGDALTLTFLSASYEGEAPRSERFSADVAAVEGGFALTLTFDPADPLYGWAVNYDTAAGVTTVWLKHRPALSGDPAAPLAGVTVMLDPGHGGTDKGAMGSAGLDAPLEKELNLSAAMAARYRLEQLGATVLMTRTDDVFPTLGDRVSAMNELHPDLFISIHHNSIELTNDVNLSGGTEAYWFYEEGRPLADELTGAVAAATGRADRGSAYGYYYVTRSNICPATLLELGFVTNPAEYENCADPQNLWAEGGAIAGAVYRFVAACG